MHPREHRLTRRNLVRGAIGAGGGNPAVQKFVVPKPTGPNGLPLPRTDNSVTWAITDDNPP
ncbi:MAG TPA: hypothetical protein VK546_11850, partial [Gaiellales bacterium]|nr:hypothetical protein [Gaiellales bacterium]